MTQAYVGKGLPKFNYRKLLAKARSGVRARRNGGDIYEWHRRMRVAYKDATGENAPSEYDCSHVLIAMKEKQWSQEKPCMSGVLAVICQMMSAPVANAVARNVYGYNRSFRRGREFWRFLRTRFSYQDIPRIQEVLKRARKK